MCFKKAFLINYYKIENNIKRDYSFFEMSSSNRVGKKRTSLFCTLEFCKKNLENDYNDDDITKDPRFLLEGSSIIDAILSYYFLPTRYNRGLLPSDQSGFLKATHNEIIQNISQYGCGDLIFDSKFFYDLGKKLIEYSTENFSDLRKDDLRTEIFSIADKLRNLDEDRLSLSMRLLSAGLGSKIEQRIEQLYVSKNLDLPRCNGFEDSTEIKTKLSSGSEYFFLCRKIDDTIHDFNRRAYPFNKW